MEFLVQYAIEGIEEFTNKIVNSCWIINATNESDINEIVELHVYDITEFGRITCRKYALEGIYSTENLHTFFNDCNYKIPMSYH